MTALTQATDARREMRRMAFTIALIGMIGPAAIDLYIPALPAIAEDLSTTNHAVQFTIMAYFVTFGLSQLIYGPVSDMLGRKLPIYFGVGVFAVASLGCTLATSVEMLILFRAMQGFGAAAAMVIPRAIIRDRYRGVEATRLMALVMLVIAIGPMLAPMVGSALIVPFGWRSTFLAMMLVAALSIYLNWRVLPETLDVSRRVPVNVSAMGRAFRVLIVDRNFLALVAIGGLGMANFFAFLAESPFIYMEHFGLNPTLYSIAFAFNAVGFFGASQLAAGLGERFGIPRVVRLATFGFAAFTVLNLLTGLLGIDNFFVLLSLIWLANACLGLVVPTSMILSLEDHGDIAGMASSFGGTAQMLVGALAIVVVGLIPGTGAMPLLIVMASCGALAAIIVLKINR